MKRGTFIYICFGIASCLCLSSCGNRHSVIDTTMTTSEDSNTVSNGEVESYDESYSVSSGYSTDPDYRPTVSDDGDYHTIDGRRRQIQYQGSQEQQRDLDMIDEYMRTHPEY